MTNTDLLRRLHDHPFKPFKIRLVGSSTYQIHEPWMVMVGDSSAIVATETRKNDHGYEIAYDWRTVSITHMMELSDLEPRSGNSKRKK